MLFNSYEFAVFLPIVLIIYYTLARRAQNVWLLFASWVFYGWWDYRFLALLAISTIVDFYCGQQIANAIADRKRQQFLIISIVTNLTILVVQRHLAIDFSY